MSFWYGEIMNISYDHYKIFYNVAKYKSFSRAAEITLCNQPNLTRAVKVLEQELGCTLFERTNRGVSLTQDGKELYEHISIAFEHIQAGEEAICAKHSMDSGVVSIGATEIALRCYLLPILSNYHELYPNIRIKILNVTTPQAQKMVENNLIDFAVVTTPVNNTKLYNTTVLSTFSEVPVCSKNYKIKDNISFKELSKYPIISLGCGTSTYEFYVKEFLKHGCDFSFDIEAATADQIMPLIKYGLGIGFVPEQFLDGEDDVRKIKLNKPISTRDILLIRRKKHSLHLPARKLVELIIE